MKKMRVLVVGGGGREHTLVWKLAQSPRVGEMFVAPGNAGSAEIATNIPIGDTDVDALVAFATENQIDLTVVGPEAPLAAGLSDALRAAGITVFGPSQAAARLESSKAFAKQFMLERAIPTGQAATFTEFEAAMDALHSMDVADGVVVKASGLAAGKGVIVCDTLAEAEAALRDIMQTRAFGAAGDEVLLEERMRGPELSLLVLTDGTTAVPLMPSRDHKRAYDHDEGPNTGGMGAYGPPADVDQALIDTIMETIVQPTIDGMAELGEPYVGVLYAGLMLTAEGPRVIEFNCRFGDPETQVVLPMLDADLAEVMLACVNGTLSAEMVQQHAGACATVVMASPGYPGSYPKGLPISGTEAAVEAGGLVFHAGTRLDDNGDLTTSGGRVLAVTARGEDLDSAVANAYAALSHIHFDGAHFRNDIGRAYQKG